ncbi:MAG TPA: metallophosphoesterase [Bacillota bacterium]
MTDRTARSTSIGMQADTNISKLGCWGGLLCNKQLWRRSGQLLLCAFIFLSLLTVFGKLDTVLGPFQIKMEFTWGWPGESRLVIPPLGEVTAKTHHLPVALSATVERIDLALLQHELMGIVDPDQYFLSIIPKARTAFYYFLAKLCFIGGIAGLCGRLCIGWRSFQRLWRSFVVGFLMVVLLLGCLGLDFDWRALENPRYEGALEAAPWALSLIDQGLTQLPAFSAKLSLVAGNLSRLFSQVDKLDSLARIGGDLKVLHVSDIHNNPAGLEFIGRVIEGFGVDLVIDTGDLTDYGTALETELTRKIRTLDVKYVFIPGNHDSPEVIKSIGRFSNVTVLEGGLFEYKGLTIMGWTDPAVRISEKLMAGLDELEAEAELVADYWRKLTVRPDVLAVHNSSLAQKISDPPPVVIFGHTHKAEIQEKISGGQQTVWINAGTSGAAGIRGLTDDNLPYSVALLHFEESGTDEKKKYRLSAVDFIKVFSLRGKFILERKVLTGGEGVHAVSSQTEGEKES